MLLLSMSLLVQPVAAKSSEETTRGLRNNNPGNIIHTPKKWVGEVDCPDLKFKCFESPLAGLKALIRNLDVYHLKYRLTTIERIISRWSPKNENDTGRLIKDITRSLDSMGYHMYDYSNADHVAALIRGIIISENGTSPFNQSYIKEVLYDTSRVIYNGDEYCTRRSNEAVVSINREQKTAEFSPVSSYEAEREVDTRGKERQEPTVHKKDHSLIFSSSYNRIAEASRTLRSTCNLWMDRVAERVLVLHGRKGYSAVAPSDGRGDTPDSPRHPSSLSYCWTLFWRQPYI